MHLFRRISFTGLSALALPLCAQFLSGRDNSLDAKTKLDQDMRPVQTAVALDSARRALPAAQQAGWNNFLGAHGTWTVMLDRRTALPANAIGQGVPTVPGRGNSLTVKAVVARLAGLGAEPAAKSLTGESVDAYGFRLGHLDLLTRDFIRANAALFPGLDANSLVLNPYRSGSYGEGAYLWYVDYDQVVSGYRVEGARLTFRYNHGNLVQFGSENWGRVRPDVIAAVVTPVEALAAAKNYLGWDERRDQVVRGAEIKLVAGAGFAGDDDGDRDEPGRGYAGRVGRGAYNHKLVYDVTLRRAGYAGTWLVRVSAKDGSVLESRDINDYGAIKGGVYPGSATGKGTEVDIPMPFADYGSGLYANAGGGFSGTSGTTTLNGKYVKMNDACGAISQAASGGAADLGTSSGTDCTTPGHGGAGNTHASRSGYFWIDQIKQKARSFLPSNVWINGQVTANMNLNQTCNAYWNGSSVNFFKSGGGCGNTGELPDVFLHEWGHGLDQNDSTGTSSEGGTGEAYGDSTALTMGHHSCIGPGFLGSSCSGYGDACTNCTGVREIDYHKHVSNTPWTAAKNASSCPAGSSCLGPMGKECHCESLPLTEGNWDLAQALIAKYGDGAGWYKFDQLWYLTRNTAGQGFTKVSASSANGCGSANWLNVFLVANDDDGNLSNGTPDAAQIQAAYNTHGVGCSTLTSTSTQTGAALAAPSVTSTSTASSVTLNWGAVSGATGYSIFKNMIGCSYGFIKVGGATSATFTDSAVDSAGTYYYAVQAAGAAGAISQFSSCLTVTPSGTTTTYSVSGAVTTSTGAAISGATVSAGAASATTDASGNYTIAGLANGGYTLTPSKSGYSFSPANRAVTVSGANVTGQSFTGTATTSTYGISGNAGTAGASVAYSGTASGSVVADSAGAYTISGLVNGTYTLTPSKSGYGFSPASASVTVSNANATQNFTATATGGGATVLGNGVGVNSSVNGASADADYKDFTIAVPSGATNLVMTTTGASGDVDLYTKFGATPSLSVYDCRPYSSSGNETCTVATPSAGTYYLRVYNYATGNLTFTVTASYTTGGGGGVQVERLSNGDFASGTASWTLPATNTASSAGISTTGAYGHSGTTYGYLGNLVNSATYEMYQTVAIPSTATAGSVSFWLNVVTNESTTATSAYDTMTVKLTDTAGAVLCTLATYSNVNNKDNGNTAGSYVQRNFTLSSACIGAIKGKSVRLDFGGTSDASLGTTFRIDDASMKTD